MDQLTSLVFFTRAAQHRSFSIAAQQLGTSPASVSRAVQQLEEKHGTRLLNRTTRRISLTQDGEVFYERCRQILSELEEAELALSQARSTPIGTLRIDVTVAFGRLYVVPALPRLAAQYPDLHFEVSFNDRYVDLIEEGLDACVRVGSSPDSQLIIYPLATARLIVCAAPDYLKRYGEPETLDDLQHHNCLSFIEPQTRHIRDWIFHRDGQTVHIPLAGRFSFNHPEPLLEAAIAGVGIVQLYNFLVRPAIARGDLKPLLEPFASPSVPIAILYPQKRHLSAKVRVFLDFMTELIVQLRKQKIVE